MMRVALYSHFFFPEYVGGGERLALLTARGLQRNGAEVRVFTTQETAETYTYEGIPVRALPYDSRADQRASSQTIDILTSAIGECDPHVVHVVGTKGAYGVTRAANHLDLPVGMAALEYGICCDTQTLVRRGGEPCSGRTSAADCFACQLEHRTSKSKALAQIGQYLPDEVVSAARRFGRKVAGREVAGSLELHSRFQEREQIRSTVQKALSLYLAPTQYTLDAVSDWLPAHVRTSTLMYPLDQKLLEADGEKNTPNDELVVGFVGRCLPMKGLDVLLDAARRIGDAEPVRWKVYAAVNEGEHEEYARAMEDEFKAIGGEWYEPGTLSNDELVRLHSSLDVLAVPSVWPEYLGFVTLEALALGTPVVLSDWPSQQELIRSDKSGTFVSPGDPEDLAQAVRSFSRAKQRSGLEHPESVARTAQLYASTILQHYRTVLNG